MNETKKASRYITYQSDFTRFWRVWDRDKARNVSSGYFRRDHAAAVAEVLNGLDGDLLDVDAAPYYRSACGDDEWTVKGPGHAPVLTIKVTEQEATDIAKVLNEAAVDDTVTDVMAAKRMVFVPLAGTVLDSDGCIPKGSLVGFATNEDARAKAEMDLLRKTKVWVTGKGVRYRVVDMSDSHVQNALCYLLDRNRRPDADWRPEFIPILKAELQARGIKHPKQAVGGLWVPADEWTKGQPKRKAPAAPWRK